MNQQVDGYMHNYQHPPTLTPPTYSSNSQSEVDGDTRCLSQQVGWELIGG